MSDPFSRRIYLLDPHQYSQETIAVTFAKTSRSPLSFDQIAAELNEEKTSEFNEKWVVGYGHASVAEHAVLHIAIENISRLAVETVEGNRLASFTEKSSRYQKWGRMAYYTPPELEGHPLKAEYQQLCTNLFDLYLECLPRLQTQIALEHPRLSDEIESGYERRINSAALDAARYLLPAAALANLGMTANARTLEHAITKMLSSRLEEVRQIGASVKETACVSVPTLIKYASSNEQLCNLSGASSPEHNSPEGNQRFGDWFKLVYYNPLDAENVLASLLYRYGDRDYKHYFDLVTKLPDNEKKALLNSKLSAMSKHDCLPREFEHTSCTFDVLMDQGAYYEIKRHRMMTQSPQELGAAFGYATPRIFKDSNLLEHYRRGMDAAAALWSKLAAWNPAVAAYIVPNAFNRRVLLSMNMREVYTLTRLRTSPNAHFSVRRVAYRVAEEIQKVHPLLACLFLQDTSESAKSIEKTFFL